MNKKRKNRNNGIIKIAAVMLLACTLLTTADEVSNIHEVVTCGERPMGEKEKD